MSAWAALALGTICALSGCFEINYGDCRVTCTHELGCPASLVCRTEPGKTTGLCAPPDRATCPSPQNMDAATDAADAHDAGFDAEAGTAGPPSMLCHNGSCLTLPESIRKNLVLLLWPSNLPAVGSPVSVWPDQSGQGNDARPVYPTAPPHVIANGVQLDSTRLGGGFVVTNSPSLDFGSDDFTVIVVAGLSSSAKPVSLFQKSDSARTNRRQISLDWVLSSASAGEPQGELNDTLVPTSTSISQPSVGAYALRRTGDHLELHLNGTVLGSADLPSSGVSTTNAEDVFVGVGSISGNPADSVEALIAIHGPVGSSDLRAVETFLKALFAAVP